MALPAVIRTRMTRTGWRRIPFINCCWDAIPSREVAMASNAVLKRRAKRAMRQARRLSRRSGETEHVYTETRYATRRLGRIPVESSSRRKWFGKPARRAARKIPPTLSIGTRLRRARTATSSSFFPCSCPFLNSGGPGFEITGRHGPRSILILLRKSLGRATAREVIHDHSPPRVGGVDSGRPKAPEESSGY